MTFKKTVAVKERVKLMIALNGPSGSGKTFSALQLAYGIVGDWSKIAVLDTENRSALYYAGEKTGPWNHFDFPSSYVRMDGSKPISGYHPSNWIHAISEVESDPKIEILILDSISHEWQGTGGTLHISSVAKTKWMEATPLHDAFFNKMRDSRLHIIATMRVNTAYDYEKNEFGKVVPRKVGLKPIQREGKEYEFGLVFELELGTHKATATKDRTGIFTYREPFVIDKNSGAELVNWAKSETPMSEEELGTMIDLFEKFEITEKILESYFKKPFKDCLKSEVKALYFDIKNKNKDKEGLLVHITDRDLQDIETF